MSVTLPLWLLVLILLFAGVSFATHFLFPSVRWFFRRRMERAVAQLNTRLQRPIEPFKLLHRLDLIQRICYDPQVTEAIVAYAKKNGVREDVAFERARRYAREIVPSFSAFAYFGWGVRIARLLSNALYRVRLVHFDEDGLKQLDPDAAVVFVMNHRSNMDYVLVTHLAAERSALSYAVGEWAQVWPLSRVIRSMGAYFIRRKSRDSLYRMVLRRYVQMATQGGVTQAIFPEGGLSLDGALAPAKMGLLSYITDDLDLLARDVVFIPVAINYDRVLEDSTLVKAGQAGNRRFDARMSRVAAVTLKQVWLRITGRFHRFGYAAVSFGAPVSLRAHPALAQDAQALADEVMQRIAALVPVLPVPLVAHLLQGGPMERVALTRVFSETLDRLGEAQVHIPRDDRTYAAEVGLRALIERGVVVDGPEGLSIVPDKAAIAGFYARSIAHLV